ncbi:MAG: hypothetical protein U5K81_01050 [Trueperaceae bacterium]|nr:hypothetical protein [Trueperaceae bacterium]
MIEVVLSSFAAGLIATVVMLLVLYLPRLWRGRPYDVAGVLGSALTGREDARSTFLGALTFGAGGIVFAVAYGLVVRTLMVNAAAAPAWTVGTPLPVTLDAVFPLAGLVLGFAHGAVVALLMTIVVTEHHPLPKYRDSLALVPWLLVGHLVFGATAGFFHHQFLQLLLS